MRVFIPILIALAFHLIDFGSGFISAWKNKSIKSSKMRDGLFKKMGFIFCYMVAVLVDKYGNFIGFTVGVDILPSIVLYAVSTEFVSICENIHKINSDILPRKLASFFNIVESEE